MLFYGRLTKMNRVLKPTLPDSPLPWKPTLSALPLREGIQAMFEMGLLEDKQEI